MDPTRRRLLLSLAAVVPAARFLHPGTARAATGGDAAGADADTFLDTSRILTGSEALSPDVAQRVRGLLADRLDDFAGRLGGLAQAIEATQGSRDEKLRALSDAHTAFALEIAKPWYLGFVGTPSNTILKDDAAFATFLEAQAYQKVIDVVPRPTYPRGAAGWWSAAPEGVDAPAMPADVASWTFHPGGPEAVLAPDPQWRAYATATHVDIEAARRARPAATNGSSPAVAPAAERR